LIKPYVVGENEDDGSFSASLTNPTNYQTTLSNEDLIDAGYLYDTITGSLETEDLAWDTSTSWRLQPATIIEPGYTGVNAKTINYIGNIEDVDRSLELADANSNGGHYIKLQFWLLSQAETEQVIELSNVSISASNEEGSNPADLNEVVNATRLAVWLDDTVYGTINGDTPVEGDVYVFGMDIDYDYEFLSNIAGYATESVTDSGLINPLAPFNQLSDLDNNPVGSLPANHFNGAVSTQDIFVIEPEVPTLATVLIYIEGWDSDADNNIVKAKFNVGFVFRYGTLDDDE
ncbi:MAG: hypothetical protein R6U15_04145, partial [Candidatus Izemoplasmatales bacterium]